MGNTIPKPPDPIYINESYQSTRNVLERYAESIKQQAAADAEKRGKSLKGNLKKAVFRGPYSYARRVPENPCDLNFWFHTNVWNKRANERNPCRFRDTNRFSDKGEAICTNNKINGNEGTTGACAPYRRRNVCDYNLEFIDVHRIQNTHDLLGNVLVTAKYEGASIVNSYANSGMFNVCTALARSFADIGDIVRGKDLFLGGPSQEKIKLEENLKKIFENIKNENTDLNKLTTEKVREYWWALNRNDVWKAITCNAPTDAYYFVYKSDSLLNFSSDRCGHNNNDGPLTNLDYVPQFLRWYDEWAEEFCRIKKIKLENVKNACRDDSKKLYCSHNGYDCIETIRNEDILSDNPKCTGCSVKCKVYELWLRNQRNEFEKQKKKYYKEIQTYTSKDAKTDSNINNEYYKEFYEKLKNNEYEIGKKFIKLLNEGRYCKEKISGERNIDFTMTGDKDAFYRSDYCQICPECGVQCSGTTCTPKKVIHPNCKDKETYEPGDAKTTDITVLYSGDEEGDIAQKLQDFCNDKNKENDENYEKWQCYYKSSEINKCQMTRSSKKVPKHRGVMSFYAFFDLWVKNLLIDSINWKNDLTNCINNTNVTDCKNDCNTNCKCFENWAKTKENEWKKVKTIYKNENGNTNNYYKKLNNHFQGYFFHVMKELNKEEKWYKLMEDLKEKIDFSKGKADGKNSEGAIKVLFDHLKDIAERCIDNNSKDSCPPSVDTKTNPCAKPPGSKPTKSVKQLAEHMQQKAHIQLEKRGGESKLKGDATRGTYNLGGQGNTLNGDICKITKNHTNDSRPNGEPCTGKDKVKNGFRLKIGTPWTNIVQKKKKKSYKDFYLPPRRQHMCTSNLENLSTSSKGLSGDSVNDSFLGHVMLSANFEADFIKKKYKEGKNPEGFKNNATICQAIRYSFADLGDIIRGKDMWNINSDAKDLQSNLKTVFGKIKSTLNGKYNDDTLDYKQLRSDWWEANRHQVWRAMKCAMKNGNIDKCNGIPIEDYIPQRLRWMTEWAEWYCKKQSQEYEKLEEKCGMCTGKGKDQKCWKDDSECKKCRAARDAYKKEIEKWEKQWKTVSAIYQILYAKARIVASNGGPGYYNTEVQKKDRSVYDFLYELHLQNGGKKGPPPDTHPSKYVAPRVKRASPVNITPTVDTTPTVYSTAAGYVHQEAHIGDCKEQTQFCKNTIGSEVSDTEADPTYAFRHQPHDYDVELRCEDRRTLKPPPPPAPPPTTPSTPNPCGGGRDQNDNNIVSVKDVAQGMQRAVQTQLDGDKGESVLKGDIKNAKFKKNLKGSELKGQICDLDEHKHTNAESRRGYDYKGPCTGKNQGRFEIGKEWKHGSEIQFPINDYMPPRRQHMCTSNLENLHLSKEGLSDGTLASHSLLGDILLAAKYEGQNIMNLYLQNN
ncbi:hypothetical protein PFMALIP_01271, partial [Plasmodium falciparum MaliPS096_E11]